MCAHYWLPVCWQVVPAASTSVPHASTLRRFPATMQARGADCGPCLWCAAQQRWAQPGLCCLGVSGERKTGLRLVAGWLLVTTSCTPVLQHSTTPALLRASAPGAWAILTQRLVAPILYILPPIIHAAHVSPSTSSTHPAHPPTPLPATGWLCLRCPVPGHRLSGLLSAGPQPRQHGLWGALARRKPRCRQQQHRQRQLSRRRVNCGLAISQIACPPVLLARTEACSSCGMHALPSAKSSDLRKCCAYTRVPHVAEAPSSIGCERQFSKTRQVREPRKRRQGG